MTFLLSLLVCSCVILYFYRFSDDVVMSVYCYVTLYFYCASFNITRQYLALALILLSICALDKGRKRAAAFIFLVATGIHITSLITLPFLCLFNMKLTKKRLTVFLCGTAFATLGARFFLPILMKLFASFFPVYYDSYMTGYASHQVLTESGRGANIYLTVFYLAFVVYAAIVLRRQLYRQPYVSNRITQFFPFCLVAIVVGLGFAENLALNRAALYFRIAMCCMIPNAISYIGEGRTVVKICVYAITLVPYFICLSRNLSIVVPYRFCF